MIDEVGANIIAANVGMNITAFLESAEKMGTYLDVLNLQLKQLSNIKVGSMSIGNLTRDMDNINRIALAEAESQNRITLSREKGALEQERILTKTIIAEQESATKIESILAQRVGSEELNSARILAIREESIAAIARTDAARIATEEATNARSAMSNAQRIALEETTGARLAQISANTQLAQSRIATEGLRQQNMIQNASHASSQTYLGKMTKSLGSHLGTMASMVVLYGGIHLLKEGIVDFGADLAGVEQVLEETYHKMGKELSPEMMAAIGENFSVIAERWGQSVKDVLQGAKDWGRQYKDLNTIQELVNSSTLLSVVDNMSLNESVKGLEATMNQYGMVARSAGEAQEYSMRIVDSWSAVAHKSMISAQDLAQGNQKAASSARMMGIDFDNLQGMIAAGVRATGRSGNELGNTLKTMFASLHSDDAVKELHKLGVEVKDLKGNFRPAQQVFADLMIAMAGTKYNMEEVVKAVSSGKFQWSKAAAILGDYDTYVKATAQSINSAGLAQEYMAVQMDTVSRKAGQLHQALIALTVSAGNSGLTGALNSALDNLRYFVDGLNNGGMKAVAFGLAIVGLLNVMKAIETAIVAARTAQESLTVAMAIGKVVAGNWLSILTTLVALGVGAYTIGLGKAADAQTELIEQQKQAVEQHKQMSEQYSREIDFMGQLEQQHSKLSAASRNSSNTDEQKANINKSLQATEESLALTIGESSATKIKDAGYTHDAFQSVVSSLRGKQEAEKVAWNNSRKLVSEATIHMQTEINKQIEAVNAAVTAYGALGKLQETSLYLQKQFAWAKYEINPTPDNAKAVDDMNSVISDFYKQQQASQLNKLYADLIKVGSSSNPSDVPDIPTGSGFNPEPLDGDGGKEKTAKQLEDLAKKARELAVAMAENNVKAYTDDIRLLDEQFGGNIRSLDYLTKKEGDYKNALSATTVERKLVQSQIQILSSDTGKYGAEIETLKKKDMDLSVQEASLANSIRETSKVMREASVTMLESKISSYTNDITMMDAHMKNFAGNTLGYMIVKEMDYAKAISETRNERELIVSQINELSKDTNKYADEIENLTQKTKELDIQEQDLISKQAELLAQQKKRSLETERDAEILFVENKIKALEKEKTIADELFDKQDKALNAQLKALEEENSLLDEQNQLLTLRKNLAELQTEKANIEGEKNIRVIGKDGKWTYQADQSKLNDVDKRIVEAQKSINDQLEKMAEEAQKKAIQAQIDANQEAKRIKDKDIQDDINSWNKKKDALDLYWKNALEDTKINQDALAELVNKGYEQSLKDADIYYNKAKLALDKFGSEAMAAAERIQKSIAASLSIRSSANVTTTNDNSVNINQINTSQNLNGLVSAMRQLAAM